MLPFYRRQEVDATSPAVNNTCPRYDWDRMYPVTFMALSVTMHHRLCITRELKDDEEAIAMV
jgi:hypothetical protein